MIRMIYLEYTTGVGCTARDSCKKGLSMQEEEKKKALRALKTARGQIDGIIKMIEDDRYCIDISNQILASSAILKRANLLILEQHLNHCVLEAVGSENAEEKIKEIIGILSKVMDK